MALLSAALLLASCAAPSNIFRSNTALAPPAQSSVLLLPPDVVISVRNAGGETEPRADWTETATSSLVEGLEEHFYGLGVKFVPYKGEKFKDEHVDFIRQANVVMDAVQLSQTQAVIDTERQYGLSKSEIAAFEDYDADYALFVVVRASRASGGRHAVAFLSALAFGAATQQLHDATFRVGLFDMRDGQLAYANFDPNALAELGNVTKASPKRWQKAIGYLLREFPL